MASVNVFRRPAPLDPLAPRQMSEEARQFLLSRTYTHIIISLVMILLGVVGAIVVLTEDAHSGDWRPMVLVLPSVFVVGLFWLRAGLRARRRTLHVYQHGEVATGRIVDRSKVTALPDKGLQTCVKWRFAVDGESFYGTLIHPDAKEVARMLPSDDVWVLYDPADPGASTLWFDHRGPRA